MNIAIGTNTIRAPNIVLLVFGALSTLSIAVLVARMVGMADSGGKGTAVSRPAGADQYSGAPALTIFLVNTEEEAQALIAREEAYARQAESEGLEAPRPYQVLVAGTLSDESIALSTLAEIRSRWQRAGASGLEVIDER